MKTEIFGGSSILSGTYRGQYSSYSSTSFDRGDGNRSTSNVARYRLISFLRLYKLKWKNLWRVKHFKYTEQLALSSGENFIFQIHKLARTRKVMHLKYLKYSCKYALKRSKICKAVCTFENTLTFCKHFIPVTPKAF